MMAVGSGVAVEAVESSSLKVRNLKLSSRRMQEGCLIGQDAMLGRVDRKPAMTAEGRGEFRNVVISRNIEERESVHSRFKTK
jgi:hypothetical protein